jgi:phenylpropionate dioxygenase-like ring-hydroxylating dioxygenase large terminal subunit
MNILASNNIPETKSPPPEAVFNNPKLLACTWYVACRAKDLKCGTIRSIELGPKRLVIYRAENGLIHAIEAHCPHMGANLAQGQVSGSNIECAFHHWQVGKEGAFPPALTNGSVICRPVKYYPTAERWGLIFVFNGPEANFDLSDVLDGLKDNGRVKLMTPKLIRSHPHVVLGNGLDSAHLGPLHGLELIDPPQVKQGDPHWVEAKVTASVRSPFWKRLIGVQTRPLKARFRAIAGSFAFAEITEPFRLVMLFTGKPTREGHCATQTVLFLQSRSPRYLTGCYALMFKLLHADHQILDQLDFHPGLTEQDAIFGKHLEVINAMPTY